MTTRQQYLGAIQRVGNFCPVGNTTVLACSGTSASVELPALPAESTATDILIYNAGSVAAFLVFGTSAPTAVAPTDGTPANGFPIPPGTAWVFDKGQNTFVGGITASSTATVYLTQGIGS